jgi:hypothetical protein
MTRYALVLLQGELDVPLAVVSLHASEAAAEVAAADKDEA